jgi:hypothetical protein
LIFGKDVSHLIVANVEIKVFGLKSGKIIKEFRGHQGIVNDIIIYDDGNYLSYKLKILY